MRSVRGTLASQLVLRALLARASGETYGLEVIRATGLRAGTVYPILKRLEDAGWLSSNWEDIDPEVAGRPARRLYRFTGDGVAAAHEMLNRGRPRINPEPGFEAGI